MLGVPVFLHTNDDYILTKRLHGWMDSYYHRKGISCFDLRTALKNVKADDPGVARKNEARLSGCVSCFVREWKDTSGAGEKEKDYMLM